LVLDGVRALRHRQRVTFTSSSNNRATFYKIADGQHGTAIGVEWENTPSEKDMVEANEWFTQETGAIHEGSVLMEDELAREQSAKIYSETGTFKNPQSN
jgi:hypothetical protein